MKVIPTPPEQRTIVEDKRNEFLEDWKKLFQSIHPNIKVILHHEKGFENAMYQLLEDRDFGNFNKDAKIIVWLPKEFESLGYLIGLAYNQMYSEREVIIDQAAVEENDLPSYEPQTKEWGEFYKEVCDILNRVVIEEIPKPDTTDLCSICEKPTRDNLHYVGDNPICSKRCLDQWDENRANLDEHH